MALTHTPSFAALGSDGVVDVGAVVQPGDYLVNRETPVNTTDMVPNPDAVECRPSRVGYKEPSAGRVQRVVLTNSETDRYVLKIVVRDMRRPELGDKFSSRHGQKGVVGLIVGQEDMPFTEKGLCPDMIMNPHGFPSRMTVGKMIELIAGKAGLCDGRRRYGTAFGGDSVASVSQVLVQHGFNYAGKDLLMSGGWGVGAWAWAWAWGVAVDVGAWRGAWAHGVDVGVGEVAPPWPSPHARARPRPAQG